MLNAEVKVESGKMGAFSSYFNTRQSALSIAGINKCGSNSVVESQPSKLLVAGSIPVSRSSLRRAGAAHVAGRARKAGFGWQASLHPMTRDMGEKLGTGLPAEARRRYIRAKAGRCSSVGRARPW